MHFELGTGGIADPQISSEDLAGVKPLTQWYNRPWKKSSAPEQYWWVHRRWKGEPPKKANRSGQTAAAPSAALPTQRSAA